MVEDEGDAEEDEGPVWWRRTPDGNMRMDDDDNMAEWWRCTPGEVPRARMMGTMRREGEGEEGWVMRRGGNVGDDVDVACGMCAIYFHYRQCH